MATFQERLVMLREKARLTQARLAELVEVSTGAVGNWESGLNMPSRAKMRKISEVLGTTELFLSGDSDHDLGAFVEETAEYSGALPFAKMTYHELDFIFASRVKEFAEAVTPKTRSELLGLIADLANEMKNRVPGLEKENISRQVKPEGAKK